MHGATARPQEAKWSLRLAAVLWVCYDRNICKDPNEYCDVTSVLYSKDMCAVVINIQEMFELKTADDRRISLTR